MYDTVIALVAVNNSYNPDLGSFSVSDNIAPSLFPPVSDYITEKLSHLQRSRNVR